MTGQSGSLGHGTDQRPLILESKHRGMTWLESARYGDPMFRTYIERVALEVSITGLPVAVLAAMWLGAKGTAKLLSRFESVSRVLDQMGEGAGLMVGSLVTTQAVARAERIILPLLAKRGWLVSPIAPWDEPQRLQTLYDEQGVDAVESHLISQLDEATCRSIVRSLGTRPSFEPWAQTLAKAVDAHVRGDHELAIPIWLVALEGVTKSETGIENLFSDAARMALRAKLLPGAGYKIMAEAWIDVLIGLARPSRHPRSAVMSRHAVLHDERPFIGDRRDSLQCILTLQILHHLLAVSDAAKAAEVRVYTRPSRPQRVPPLWELQGRVVPAVRESRRQP